MAKKYHFVFIFNTNPPPPTVSAGGVAVCRDVISYYQGDPTRQEQLFRDLVVLLRMLAKSGKEIIYK